MEYSMEFPSPGKFERTDRVGREPEFFSPTLDERLRGDEAFLTQAMENLEQRRSETDQLHRTYDEKERLAAFETNRRQTEQQAQQRDEKEPKLLAEIETLRNAEAEQRQRIEAANAASRWRSAEVTHPEAETECAVGGHEVEEQVQLAQLDTIAAECDATARVTERDRINARIKTLGDVATKEIDRMEEAKSRLSILEKVRVHAEKMVYERAEREIRLQAEIDALQRAEAAQKQRIEEAEAEASRLTEEQNRLQEAVETHQKARAEARQRASAEALERIENEKRLLADEEEKRLEHLEAIRARAEAASHQRTERESLLNSQLLAFSEAAAEQLQQIEKAEVDLKEAEQALRQLEEKVRQTNELVPIRMAEIEEHRQALEAEIQALADQEEQRLAELEIKRAQAEAEAGKRAELEHTLNTDLESLAAAEATQRKRLDKARAQVELLSEEETRLSRNAETQEERIAELESIRNQTQTRVQIRREEEQCLIAEIEALNQIATEQFSRIADAEAALAAHKEKLQDIGTGLNQKDVNGQRETVKDHCYDAPTLADDIQLEIDNVETTDAWSIAENSDQTVLEKVEVSDLSSASPVMNVETAAAPTLPVVDREWMESHLSQESLEDEGEETPTVSLEERLKTHDPAERAKAFKELSRLDENDAFTMITGLFDDGSEEVRNAAARALYSLNPSRAETFTRALREAPPERRRQIIRALDSSRLAAEAIESLAGESREKTYDAFSVLFLMAKAGEVQTLLHTIEKHANSAVRLSVIKLLTFSNRRDIIPALRSLAVRGALPIEVRSALMESIYEISSNARERALSAA